MCCPFGAHHMSTKNHNEFRFIVYYIMLYIKNHENINRALDSGLVFLGNGWKIVYSLVIREKCRGEGEKWVSISHTWGGKSHLFWLGVRIKLQRQMKYVCGVLCSILRDAFWRPHTRWDIGLLRPVCEMCNVAKSHLVNENCLGECKILYLNQNFSVVSTPSISAPCPHSHKKSITREQTL